MDDEYINQLEEQLEKLSNELCDAHRFEDAIEKIIEYLEMKIIKAKTRDEFGFTSTRSGSHNATLKDILIIIDEIVAGNVIRDSDE